MSTATADAAILGQMERLAMIRRTWGAAVTTGGGKFWTRMDAAADETYENAIVGVDMTALDTKTQAGDVGNWAAVTRWFDMHRAYLAAAADATVPGLGLTTDPWNTYLELRGIRAPWDINELYYHRYGVRLDPQNVYPKGLWAANLADNVTAGLHQFGEIMCADASVAYTSVDGDLLYSYAPICAASNGGITGNYDGTILCKNQAGASKTVTLSSLAAWDTADLQTVLGAAAITTTSAAGQKVVTSSGVQVAGAFTAGEWVILVDEGETPDIMELAQVDTIATNALTMKTDLLHSFATGSSDIFIWPLYTGIASVGASTSGGAGEAIQFYARPDRAIAL